MIQVVSRAGDGARAVAALRQRVMRATSPPVSALRFAHERRHCGHCFARRGVATRALSEVEEVLHSSEEGIAYNAAINSAYWGTRPVSVLVRFLEIASAFGWWYVTTGRGQSANAASVFREVLVDLGPAFVKIGQAVSSRPDVVPPAWLKELERLQDNIRPFDTSIALSVIQQDLGGNPNQFFRSISAAPVAAASLGQVYKAELRDSGESVAVKVQRPDIIDRVSQDLYILRNLAIVLRRLGKLNTDLPALIDDWASSIFRELDYRKEAQNAVEFREAMTFMPQVYVPTIYPQLTTRRVLTMEWVDGSKVTKPPADEVERLDDLRVVEVGVQCSLEQMLQQGFYHADPHPGNLLKMKDGRLAYLDFGMMGRIGIPIRQGLIRATLHLVNREFGALADDFVALGFLPDSTTKPLVVPALTGVFQEALASGVRNLNFGQLSGNLGRTMYEYKFRIPPYYTLLVRSLTILEGIALARDPSYKVLDAAYPWVANRLLTDSSPELRSTLTSLLYKNGRFQFSRLESLLQQAARRPLSTDLQRQPADAAPATSAPSGTAGGLRTARSGSALRLLLSSEGSFVRDIVMDEIAKGIDAAGRVNFDMALQQARSQLLGGSAAGAGAGSSGGGGGGGQVAAMQLFNATSPGEQLALALARLPKLSNEEDRVQIEGITSLAQLLQDMGRKQHGSRSQNDAMQAAAESLMWIVEEGKALPVEARQQALWLPVDLLQRVSSRVAARALRLALGSQATTSQQTVVRSSP